MIRIVIVEDEAVLRKGLALHTPWEKFDAMVIADAADGLEGERLIEKLNPDIAITDIRMPGQSGIEMMRNLKDKCDTEFIIISGYGEFSYAQEAISLGARGYIMKPIDDDEFSAVILKTIGVVKEKQETRKLRKSLQAIRRSGDLVFKEYLSQGGGDYREKYLESAIETIRTHYRENLNVRDLAESLGISESSFGKLFKSRTGYTFLEYLTHYRMKKALELLDKKEVRVNEVASLVGYADYRHFGELFKKVFGITPSEYRKGQG